MTDVLNPNNEYELAEERELPDIGSFPKPEGQPLSGGFSGNTESNLPIEGQPLPPPATNLPIPPSEEGFAQTPVTPELSQSNIRYSPTEVPLPNFNGIDALQEATSTPSMVSEMVSQQQAALSPDSIRSVMGLVRPAPIQWSGQYESDAQQVRDQLAIIQSQNHYLVEQNDLGIQNIQFGNTGERTYNVSAVDNGVAARGLLSGTGKRLQDEHDPRGENNTSNKILGWLDKAGRFAVNAVAKTLGWIGSGLALDVGGQLLGDEDAIRYNEQIRERQRKELGENWGIENLTSTEFQSGKYQMNPLKGQWGDYGDHPILSPVLYGLNLPQAVLNGLIYDAADLIHGDSGKSDKQRSRTLQALEGRDYGASNRWSENKYLSLQEPEGFTSGQLARNTEKYKSNPLAGYWDFPEWFEKTPVGKVVPGNEKINHVLFQTLPALAAEVITGGLSDYGVSSLVSGAKNAIVRQAPRQLAEGVTKEAPGAIVKVESDSIIPFYETRPVTTRVRTTVPTILDPMGQVLPMNKMPSGSRVSTNVVRPPKALLSSEDLALTRRSNEELSALARNTIDPRTGKPIYNRPTPLTDAQVANLNRQFGNLFDRYGKEIPDIEASKYIDLGDGDVREIIHPELNLLPPTPQLDPEKVSRMMDELDDLNGKLGYELETGGTNADSILSRIDTVEGKILESTSRMPEEELYGVYRKKLPETLVSDDYQAIPIGNELVKHELILDAQRPTLDQLIEEVDTLKEAVEESVKELDEVGIYTRGEIEHSLTTRELMEPGSVPELRVEPYEPKLIPPIETLPTNPVFEEVLESPAIRLARKFQEYKGTENYTNLHVMRNALPDLSREEFDEAFYELIRNDVIEPSTLAEVKAYTPEQMEAGIPQPVGGSLFFGIINDDAKLDSFINSGSKATKTDEALKPSKRNRKGTNKVLDKYVKANPELPDAVLTKDDRLWLHGSASPVGIRERDILNGGTPSEFGVGIYLTQDQKVADQAAYAIRQSNRPPRPDSVDGAPYRTTVDAQKLIKVLKLSDPPKSDVRNIFYEARKSLGLGDDTTSTRVADMWNQFDRDYFSKFGNKPSESMKREFQQKVLIGLQKANYDAGIYYGTRGKTLVVYQPHKLGVVGANTPLETPSLTKQYEARAWLDNYTFTEMGDDVTRSHALQSRLAYESKALQDTSEVLVEEQFKQGEIMEGMVRLEDELEGITYRQKEDLLRLEPETPKLDIQKQIRESNNLCL